MTYFMEAYVGILLRKTQKVLLASAQPLGSCYDAGRVWGFCREISAVVFL